MSVFFGGFLVAGVVLFFLSALDDDQTGITISLFFVLLAIPFGIATWHFNSYADTENPYYKLQSTRDLGKIAIEKVKCNPVRFDFDKCESVERVYITEEVFNNLKKEKI